jgi:hypothetical protein
MMKEFDEVEDIAADATAQQYQHCSSSRTRSDGCDWLSVVRAVAEQRLPRFLGDAAAEHSRAISRCPHR